MLDDNMALSKTENISACYLCGRDAKPANRCLFLYRNDNKRNLCTTFAHGSQMISPSWTLSATAGHGSHTGMPVALNRLVNIYQSRPDISSRPNLTYKAGLTYNLTRL